MSFSRLKRLFGRKPKREERGDADAPTPPPQQQQQPVQAEDNVDVDDDDDDDDDDDTAATIEQEHNTADAPAEDQNDVIARASEPGPQGGLDQVPLEPSGREHIWQRAYDRLDPELREQYAILLSSEWKRQKPTGEDVDRQMQHDFLIQAGLQKLEETTTLQRGLETASKVIDKTRGFVDQAVKVSPEASLIWAGVCIVLPLVTNLQAAEDAIRDGFDFATRRLRYYIALETYIPEETVLQERLYENLLKLFGELLKLQIMTVIQLYNREIIKGMLAWEDWTKWREEIETLEGNFNSDWHQVDSAIRQRTVDKIHQSIDQGNTFLESLLPLAEKTLEVQQEQLDHTKQMQALLEKLDQEGKACHQLFRLTSNGPDDYYESYKTQIEDRVEGTCGWFLEHPSYLEWLDKPALFPLVVSADPGFGKSVLANYLVDSRLQGKVSSRDPVVCYFFFDAQTQNTVRQALCALIHQLIAQNPDAIRHVLKPYRANKEKLVNVVSDLWNIFSGIVSDPEIRRVVVILDALDECVTSDSTIFIKQLLELWEKSRKRQKFTFLVTTQPRTSIMSEFHQIIQAVPDSHISAADHAGTISSEVNRVIEMRAAELQAKGRLDKTTMLHLVKRLQALPAQRTYLWTHAIFELINDDDFENSEDSIDEVISVLPRSVEAAYEAAFNASQAKYRPWIRKAFCIILAASRPLTLREMHISLQLDVSSSKPPRVYHDLGLTLRNRCGFLVTISAGRVYLIHQTARDFLMEKGFPRDDGDTGSAPITEMESHQALAWSCVKYFDLVVEPGIALSKKHGEGTDYSSQIKTVVGEHGEFLQYVAENWFQHIKRAGLDSDKDLAQRVRPLCDPQNHLCKVWKELYHSSEGTSEFVDFHNVNTLWIASFTGITAVVEELLEGEVGAASDARNLDGQNTVLIAALQGNDRVLTRLLNLHLVRTDLRDSWRRGALQAAVESRNPAAVKVLVQSKRVVDVSTLDRNGQTPLGAAIQADDVEMIQVFVDSIKLSKSDICNARDSCEKTPLIIACQQRMTNLFWKLLDSGRCDVNIQDDDNRTALSYSVLRENVDFVRALLKIKDTDSNIPDRFGETAFTYAVILDRSDIAQEMIDSGKVHINATDKYGRTALHRAVRRGQSQIVQTLLDNLADADAPDKQGWTPLMEAAGNGDEGLVRLLLETRKVDVNRTNENGTT
ncbi:ankyrin repeat-containing domain protein [Aspergillus undulatus]|uniref:ankyrin repeat-containing domain protein n=1 Tax=Aspergillus undulatus TaxID=1810928 RepID=UPI003CCE13DB